MNVFVSVDLAGIAGVVAGLQPDDGHTLRYQHKDMGVVGTVWRGTLALAAYVS